MKEPENSQVSTVDPGRKKKKRKWGTNFSNSKHRRRRELKKKEQSCTQGSEPPTDLSKTGRGAETRTSSSNKELQRIKEEREQSGLRELSMGESKHRSDSEMNKFEETKWDSIGTVSLSLGFYALGSYIHLGSFKDGIWNWVIQCDSSWTTCWMDVEYNP